MKRLKVKGFYQGMGVNYKLYYYCIKCHIVRIETPCKHYIKHRWGKNVCWVTLEYTGREMDEMFKPKMVRCWHCRKLMKEEDCLICDFGGCVNEVYLCEKCRKGKKEYLCREH